MRIKILVLSLVVATLAITCSTTTLAYFKDSYVIENTFAVGNVKVQNNTVTSGICGGMIKDDTCTKAISVTNTGSVDAFVRVRVLVPESLVSENTLAVSTANNAFVETPNTVNCNTAPETQCKEYVSTWNNILSGNTVTPESTISFTYNSLIKTGIEGENTEGAPISLAELGIKIYTEAIQAQGFANASDAFSNF